MICPNPNCKSNMPDDSLFCPDCGTAIKNIASLRTEAKDVVEKYPKGYKALVDSGILPPYSEYLSAEGYELIIKKKSDIVQKHIEFLRAETKQISISYPKGYEHCVSKNSIPRYSDFLTLDEYEKILSNREFIIQQNNRIIAEEQKKQQKTNELENTTLTISTNILCFENSGRFRETAYISSTYACSVKADRNWIHLIKQDEKGQNKDVSKLNITTGEISIHVDKYSGKGREGYVTISNGSIEKRIMIVQGIGVIQEKAIRKETSEIVTTYVEGYRRLPLPRYSHDMKLEDCLKIISRKDEIIKKHNEVIKKRHEIESTEKPRSSSGGCLSLLITIVLSINGGLLFIVWILSNAL